MIRAVCTMRYWNNPLPTIPFYLFWIECWVSDSIDLLLNQKFIIKMHFSHPITFFLPTLMHSTVIPFHVLLCASMKTCGEKALHSLRALSEKWSKKTCYSFHPFSRVSRENAQTKPKSLLCLGSSIPILIFLPISFIFRRILLLQLLFSFCLQTANFIHIFFFLIMVTDLKNLMFPSAFSTLPQKVNIHVAYPLYLEKHLLLNVLLDK